METERSEIDEEMMDIISGGKGAKDIIASKAKIKKDFIKTEKTQKETKKILGDFTTNA